MASQWAAAGTGSGARRSFTPRKLVVSGRDAALPGSVPLIYPDDMNYDPSKNKLTKKPGTQRRKLLVSDIGRELLESIHKPVAVLAVCGPYRTGKSYILSRMIDEPKAFELGNTVDACTYGIWVGTTVLECDDFAIVLLDTEGICNVKANATNDAKILVLTVLLSSLFVYNSMKVAQSTDLETMSCFTHLTKSIIIRSGLTQQETMHRFRDHFPDFLWLLRDFTLQLVDTDGRATTARDYIMKKVLASSESYPPAETDYVAGIIRASFPSIECQTIPPPSDDPYILQNIEDNEAKLSEAFNSTITNVIQDMLKNIRIKKGFHRSQIVTGEILAELMDQIVGVLNSPDAMPNLDNAWQAIVTNKLETTVASLVKEYEEEMANFAVALMPIEEELSHASAAQEDSDSLMGIHRVILNEKIKTLQKAFCTLLPLGTTLGAKTAGEVRQEFTEKLLALVVEREEEPAHSGGVVRAGICGGVLYKFTSQNCKKSKEHCTKLFTGLHADLQQKASNPNYTFEQLQSDLLNMRSEYFTRAIGPAKWDVYEEKRQQLELEEARFQHLQGYKKEAFQAIHAAERARAEQEKLEQQVSDLLKKKEEDKKLHEEQFQRLEDEIVKRTDELLREEHEKREGVQKQCGEMMDAKFEALAKSHEKMISEAGQKREEQLQIMQEDKRKAKGVLDCWEEATHAVIEAGFETLKAIAPSKEVVAEIVGGAVASAAPLLAKKVACPMM